MEERPESSESASPGASPRPPVDPPSAYPPPPPPGYAPYAYPPPPRGGGAITRALVGVFVSVLIVSLLVNVYLVGALVKMTSGLTESEYQDGRNDQRIVILPVRGLIDDSSASFVRQALVELRENRPKALILRVDSGGGYVSPSDRIWHEIVQFKSDTNIPVIASFGGLAASGGYYIAAPADAIVAEPTCMTGSIGVMAQGFTIDQLLMKIGVTPEVLMATTSPRKGVANDISRPWTQEDRAVMIGLLDHLHAQFVDVVQKGRTQLKPEEVEAVADGRIFTAEAALTEKLIDEVGYLDRAIEVARQRANIAANVQPRVTVISQPPSLMGSLLRSQQGSGASSGLDGEQLRRWVTEWSVPQLMYLWQGGR